MIAVVQMTRFDVFCLVVLGAMLGAIGWWLWTIYRDALDDWQRRQALVDGLADAADAREGLRVLAASRVTRRRPCGCDPDLFEGCPSCIRPNVTTPPHTPGA